MKLLNHVCWIGGSPCSGKSSIAEKLVQTHGMRLYSCDAEYHRHMENIDAARFPMMAMVGSLDWNGIFVERTVERQIADEFAFYREEFQMILEDLSALPVDRPILAEGAALLPELVAPLLEDSRNALWIVPSEGFQREHYSRRPWIQSILSQTSDPALAFENWMSRDAGFASQVTIDARDRGLQVLVVDGSTSLEENYRQAEAYFGLR